MALVIEDGTGVAGANTYVLDLEYTNYATSRGLTIGADATAREQELIAATDFLESFREQFKGIKTAAANDLQFPRNGLFIDDSLVSSTDIPIELKRAQMEAGAVEFAAQLTNNKPDQNVQTEKVDGLERSYFSGGKAVSGKYQRVNNWLDSLLKKGGAVSLTRL